MQRSALSKRTIIACLAFSIAGACSRAPEPETVSAPDSHQVTITAVVPDETPAVFITGNLPVLGNWDPGVYKMTGEGAERVASFEAPDNYHLEYKFTLGAWDEEASGPSGTIFPNFELDIDGDKTARHDIVDFKKRSDDYDKYIADWEGSGVLGTLIYRKDVSSAHLSEKRHVEIWLPPGYDESDERYPVIYMSDGQNLFDPRIANTGVDWGVDEAMMAGVAAGKFRPAIVVATWSTSKRFEEYSPWHDAPDYARFLIEELKPKIDAEFRTLTGPEATFHMGSSMGGLLSFYLVRNHPEVFSACGCVSTHFPLSDAVVAEFMGGEGTDPTPYVVRDIAAGATMPKGQRLYFDYGTLGLDAAYGPSHDAVRDWLLVQGVVEGEDFVIRRYDGADHNERSWRARIGDQLEWLLAKRE